MGTEGETHLELAISLNKHVVIWRLPGRAHMPIPDTLADYDNYIIVDGIPEDLAKELKQYWELAPSDGVVIHSKGYSDEIQQK